MSQVAENSRATGAQDSLLICRTLTASGDPEILTNNLLLMFKLRRNVGLNTKRKAYSIHKGMRLKAY